MSRWEGGDRWAPGRFTRRVVADIIASLREQIENLRYDLTTNGVTPGTTLKVPGVDALPTGVTYNAGTKTVTIGGTFTGSMDAWDFTNLQVTVQGPVTAFRNCKFGEPLSTPSGVLRYVDLYTTGSIGEFDRCTFEGPYTFGGVGEAVAARSTGTGVSYVAAQIGRYNRCRFVGLTSDAIKVNGATATGGQVIEWSYFGAHVNLPNEPTLWSAGTTYGLNQAVSRADGFVYLSKIAGNVGNALPSGGSRTEENASWKGVDPHCDHITVVSAVGNGITVRTCLFDNTDNPPGSFGPYPSLGVNNAWRVSRNSGTDFPVNRVRFENNVLYRAPGESQSFAIDVSEGVATNFNGPIEFVNNWLAPNANGLHYHPNANDWVDTWSGNRDYFTDALIAGPTLRPVGPTVLAYTVVESFDSLTGFTGFGTNTLTLVPPVAQGTGAIEVATNGATALNLVKTLADTTAPTNWDYLALLVEFPDRPEEHAINGINTNYLINGQTYAFRTDASVAGTAQPVYGGDQGRGRRWITAAAGGNPAIGADLKVTDFNGASLSTAPAGSKVMTLQFNQLAASNANFAKVRVCALVRPDSSYVSDIALTWDDVNDFQYAQLFPMIVARNLPITIYAAAGLIGTGAKFTMAQALEMKASGLVTFCADSDRTDKPLIAYDDPAAAIAQANAHGAELVASGLSSFEDTLHMCYSYGPTSYRSLPVTLTCTANNTEILAISHPQAWSTPVVPGMVVKGTGLGVDPTVVSVPTSSSIVLSAPVPAGILSLTFCAISRGRTVTCNGTTTVGVDTTGVLVGQEVRGHTVPANTIVTAIVTAGVSGTITVSNPIPNTCLKASFFLTSAQFAYNKMEDALLAAGYRTGRRAVTEGGFFAGFGVDPRLAIGLPSLVCDSGPALFGARLNTAIRGRNNLIGVGHFTGATVPSDVSAILDLVVAARNAGRINPVSIPQMYANFSGRTFA